MMHPQRAGVWCGWAYVDWLQRNLVEKSREDRSGHFTVVAERAILLPLACLGALASRTRLNGYCDGWSCRSAD